VVTVDRTQLTALGDPTRRTIFELIAERPRSVAEITRRVPVSQSAVSQHLKVLRDSRLVRAEPKGASNVYHIDPHGLGQMRAWLDRFWSKTLAAYKVAVEQPPRESK
jgi:DNA-binding transcriptional ArsR family regulator